MEAPFDINKVIRRLGLIKGLILLEEFEEVNSHVQKLNGAGHDIVLKGIISDIDSKFYSDAIKKIEEYINQNQQIILYEDPEVEVLKIEIKKLEIEIGNASDEVADTEKLIHDFGIRHNNELGEIVSKILKLRKEKLEHEQDESAEKKKEYEEAKKDYEQYSKQYEETKAEQQFVLTEEEKQELKIKYRKATKLCHPDVVTDELKEHAEIMFRELQEAYDRNDLKKVTEILSMLEKGEIFIAKSEGINEKIKLKAEVIKLRKKLSELNLELIELKETETYQTIIKIHDWDKYFTETKQKLNKELTLLEK
ncbi:MAG TPA: J domain-containing protein [Bacteroidia bacterium]|nr:J domain-containing protein [Bacteroidia bacterium]